MWSSWVLLQVTELDVENHELGRPCCPQSPTGLPDHHSQRDSRFQKRGQEASLSTGELSLTPQPEAWGRGGAGSSEDPLPATPLAAAG